MMMKNLRQEGFEIGRDKTRRLMKSSAQGEAEAQIQSDDRQQSQAAGGNKRIESRVSAPNQLGDRTSISGPSNLPGGDH